MRFLGAKERSCILIDMFSGVPRNAYIIWLFEFTSCHVFNLSHCGVVLSLSLLHVSFLCDPTPWCGVVSAVKRQVYTNFVDR